MACGEFPSISRVDVALFACWRQGQLLQIQVGLLPKIETFPKVPRWFVGSWGKLGADGT